MKTRAFKTRNGTELVFSAIGLGTGADGRPLRAARRKDGDRHGRAGLRERRSRFRYLAPLRQRPRRSRAWARGFVARRRRRDHRLDQDRPDHGSLRQAARAAQRRVFSPGFVGGYPHAPRFDYSYDGTMRSVEHSLAAHGPESPRHRPDPRLRRLDAWQGRSAGRRFKEAMEGAYRALDKLRNEKTVKAIGFGINEADTCVKFAQSRRFRRGDDGRALFAARPERPGRIPAARARKEDGRHAGGRVQFRHSGDRGSRAPIRLRACAAPSHGQGCAGIEAICATHGTSHQARALQFALAHPAVVSVVLGAVKPAEVEANVHDASRRSPRACGPISNRPASRSIGPRRLSRAARMRPRHAGNPALSIIRRGSSIGRAVRRHRQTTKSRHERGYGDIT